jgi:hypothetical protein
MNMTKRAVLLGGLVASSLAAGIPAASALTDPPPTAKSPAGQCPASDSGGAGSGQVRLTWVIRPRPTHQRSAAI